MLHFILGRAGTGKSTLLMKRLGQSAAAGKDCILLVPEQYSFEAERLVVRALGPKLALGVEVLSFTRLCDSVFRQCGGLAGIPVSQTGKYLLMSLAVAEIQDKLKIYRKSCGNVAFLDTLVSACAELKTAGVLPARLEEVYRSCEEGALKNKLEDLTAIYGAYQALLEKGYNDPDDALMRACSLLRSTGCFEGKYIFIDGFVTFMEGEFALLQNLIAQGEAVHMAVTADELEDRQHGMGVFSTGKQTLRRLMSYARQAGVPVASPVVLEEPLRYASRELAFVSRGFLQQPEDSFRKPTEDIAYYLAPDPYREIEFVAARISHLVREKGYRFGEIAVVSRETSHYLRALELVFRRNGISYFVDDRKDVENLPLAAGLLAAVEAVRSGFHTENVLTWAKNPVAGFSPEAIAALENYCYCWGIQGELWKSDFRNNPDGFGPMTPSGTETLRRINETRASVVRPLDALKTGLEDCDGRAFGAAIYDFLQQSAVSRHLADFADTMPQGIREAFLEESAQLWDMLMETLDVFGGVLGTVKLSTTRFCELLRLSVSGGDIGAVPQMLDQVLVGKADRIRPGSVRAVFVVGAVEGEFPDAATSGGLFTDDERQIMIDLGAEIGAPTLSRAVLEKYFCYYALTLSAEKLYISSHQSRMSGEDCVPSVIVSQMEELFPALGAVKPDDFTEISGVESAAAVLAGHYREDTPQVAALLDFLEKERPALLRKLSGAARKRPHKIVEEQTARRLFGERMTLSPSRIERYHRCAFAYFARDGLRVNPRIKVEFSPLESGSFVHHVLQIMVQRHGKGLFELTPKAMRQEVEAIIGAYLEERIRQKEALPRRFSYLFKRLTDSLVRLLRRLGEEFAQSEYQPVAFELPISRADGVRPLELRTADGVSVVVEGVVDRVDVMEKNGKKYVRVVDYKSGGKEFRLDDVMYGLNMQMLLYLFTIAENGTGELSGCIPGGVLYMPVHSKYVNTERDTGPSEMEEQGRQQWKMSGLLLDDMDNLTGMEHDLAGIYIPAKLGKGGLHKSSALAGKAEMGKLSRRIKDTIAEMAQGLTRGDVASCPVSSSGHNPCDYCDYASLCGFEPGDPAIAIAKMDREAVLEQLRGDEDE